MKSRELYEAIGGIRENWVEEARKPKVRTADWLRLGAAAACLCVILGAAIVRHGPAPVSGGGDSGGIVPGGDFPAGVDPGVYSVAVYPESERPQDVETATVERMDGDAARSLDGLGEYLPTLLPEGCYFSFAYLYETAMKDGTKYYMLRASYTTGETIPGVMAADAETQEPEPVLDEAFYVMIWNHRPNTDETIYSLEDLPEYLASRADDRTFHLSHGDVYISFGRTSLALSDDEILALIRSIP